MGRDIFETEEAETMAADGRKRSPDPGGASEAETFPVQVMEIMRSYRLKAEKIKELKDRYSGLTIASPKDKNGYELVRTAKSEVTSALTDVEADRKEKKAESLKYGRNVDKAAAILASHLIPLKEQLSAEKDRIDRLVEEEKAARQREIDSLCKRRMDALIAVNAAGSINPLELPGMSEANFQAHLTVATTKWNEEQAKKAAEAAELVKLREEAEVQRVKDLEAFKAKHAELAEMNAALERSRKDAEAREAAIRAEREKLEIEKREAEEAKRREKEAKERAAELEKARAEAAEQARKEAEAKAKADAEAKAKAEEQARKDAEAKAARATEKEKMLSYFDALRSVPVPKFDSQEMKEAMKRFSNFVTDMVRGIS